ncbi:glycoside hydrolase family 25 protein [Calothrix sp. CCY 0018]|uniref:glycoside hydrolase family 25 protein n=1 Tax=Calothrix sp. CCY 0018 TaxID=3103864 RepID=UPI0039C675F7
MSVKFIAPNNFASFQLGNLVTFTGTAANEIYKVELIADEKYKLAELTVLEGDWSLDYIFNRAGKRRIIVNGFNQENKQLTSDAVDIFLVGETDKELGIDVSNHNGKLIDWQTVKSSDVSFAFAKATEGGTYVDKVFATNWKRMKEAGMIRGAYHFFRPLKDAKQQAENFLAQVGNTMEIGDLPPVLDVEHYPDKVAREWQQLSVNQRIKCVREWLEIVEKAKGVKPIIYTSPSFWQEYMNNLPVLTQYPLWLAHYTKQKPSVPANNWGGNGWTFWQYTENGTVAGISGKVDRNRFNGSFENLVAFVRNSMVA